MSDTIVTATIAISAAALPTITVLVAILLNRNDSNRLDARITSMEQGLRSEISGVRSDLRAELHGEIGGLRSDVRSEISSIRGELVALREQFHNDVLMLVGRDKEQDARITRLEARAS